MEKGRKYDCEKEENDYEGEVLEKTKVRQHGKKKMHRTWKDH